MRTARRVHDLREEPLKTGSQAVRTPGFGGGEAALAFLFIEGGVIPEADDGFDPRPDFFRSRDGSGLRRVALGHVEERKPACSSGSGRPPRVVPRTGMPLSKDSTATLGNDSRHSEGIKTMRLTL
jgi:hypothetical protein